MEGPRVPTRAGLERGAEAQSAGAPRGWGLGRGAVAPNEHGSLRAMPSENFSEISVEIAYFSAFLGAEMVYTVMAPRQD